MQRARDDNLVIQLLPIQLGSQSQVLVTQLKDIKLQGSFRTPICFTKRKGRKSSMFFKKILCSVELNLSRNCSTDNGTLPPHPLVTNQSVGWFFVFFFLSFYKLGFHRVVFNKKNFTVKSKM